MKRDEAEKMNTANHFYEQMVKEKERADIFNKTSQHSGINRKQESRKEYRCGDEIENYLNWSTGPAPLPNAPIVIKSAYFDSASFVDCSAILPSKIKRKITAHSAEVTCVAFSKSGLIMASGSTDKSMSSNPFHLPSLYSPPFLLTSMLTYFIAAVRLWDGPSGQSKTVLQGPTQSVMSVQFSPSDEALLGASNDNACRIWGVDNCRLRHTLTGHVGKVQLPYMGTRFKSFTLFFFCFFVGLRSYFCRYTKSHHRKSRSHHQVVGPNQGLLHTHSI